MTTRFKLLAADVDGTLVGSDQQVSERNRQAVQSLKKAGLTVCLATGRGVKEVLDVRRTCGLDGHADPLICTSGAIVCEGHTTRTLHIEPVDPAAAAAGCEAILSTGHTAVALIDPWRWGYDYIAIPGDDFDSIRANWFAKHDFGIREVASLTAVDDLPDILRLTAIASGPAADAIEAALTDRCGDKLRLERIFAPNYGFTVVECFSPAADKWTGVRYVAAGLRIPAADIAAIGDDINDLPLFARAGVAAAMANAAEPIRNAAHLVTDTHDHDGFAHFVERLLASEFD